MKTIIKIWISAIIILAIVFNPILIKPKGTITAKEIEFGWFSISKNNLLIVDDNPKFSSPELFIQTNKNYKTYLPPNKYYWKVRAIYNKFYIESVPSSFVLNPITALSINETSVRNDGNTRVNVTTISNNLITGSVILDINNQIPSKDSTYFEAQQT